LLELLTQQDKIAKKTKHISGLIIAKLMVYKNGIQENYLYFYYKKHIRNCVDINKKGNWQIMVKKGFRKRETKLFIFVKQSHPINAIFSF